MANPIINVASAASSLAVTTDKPWRPYTWLDSRSTRKGVVVLNKTFDLDRGVIIEGHIKARSLSTRTTDARNTYAGFISKARTKSSARR
jgi:hypothetical protein